MLLYNDDKQARYIFKNNTFHAEAGKFAFILGNLSLDELGVLLAILFQNFAESRSNRIFCVESGSIFVLEKAVDFYFANFTFCDQVCFDLSRFWNGKIEFPSRKCDPIYKCFILKYFTGHLCSRESYECQSRSLPGLSVRSKGFVVGFGGLSTTHVPVPGKLPWRCRRRLAGSRFLCFFVFSVLLFWVMFALPPVSATQVKRPFSRWVLGQPHWQFHGGN